MSTNISEEELLLRKRARRRLVGSVILVLASIIILPAIFDEPKPGNEKQEIAINLPPAKDANSLPQSSRNELVSGSSFVDEDPSVDFQNKMKAALDADETELGSPRTQKQIPIPGIKPKIDRNIAAIREAIPTASAITAGPTQNSGAVAVSQDAPTTALSADSSKGFVIQLGAYSDQTKAKQQHSNLVANGFKAYTETHNDVMRVRVGPFATRAAAENEIKKLKKLGLDGVVIPR